MDKPWSPDELNAFVDAATKRRMESLGLTDEVADAYRRHQRRTKVRQGLRDAGALVLIGAGGALFAYLIRKGIKAIKDARGNVLVPRDEAAKAKAAAVGMGFALGDSLQEKWARAGNFVRRNARSVGDAVQSGARSFKTLPLATQIGAGVAVGGLAVSGISLILKWRRKADQRYRDRMVRMIGKLRNDGWTVKQYGTDRIIMRNPNFKGDPEAFVRELQRKYGLSTEINATGAAPALSHTAILEARKLGLEFGWFNRESESDKLVRLMGGTPGKHQLVINADAFQSKKKKKLSKKRQQSANHLISQMGGTPGQHELVFNVDAIRKHMASKQSGGRVYDRDSKGRFD